MKKQFKYPIIIRMILVSLLMICPHNQMLSTDKIPIHFVSCSKRGGTVEQNITYKFKSILKHQFINSGRFLISDHPYEKKDTLGYSIEFCLTSATSKEEIFTSTENKKLPYFTYGVAGSILIRDMKKKIIKSSREIRFTAGKGTYLYSTYSKTEEAALSSALSRFGKQVRKLIDEIFPLEFKVVRPLTFDKKKNPELLLISGGSKLGVKKGMKFKVFSIIEEQLDGQKYERKDEVAEIKIMNAEDSNFSKGKLTKGKERVYYLLNQTNPPELVVVSN